MAHSFHAIIHRRKMYFRGLAAAIIMITAPTGNVFAHENLNDSISDIENRIAETEFGTGCETVVNIQGGTFRSLQEDITPPQYQGGNNAMYQKIVNNLRYTQDAMENGIEGTVIVLLVIDSDGKVESAELKKTSIPLSRRRSDEGYENADGLGTGDERRQAGKIIRVDTASIQAAIGYDKTLRDDTGAAELIYA